MVPVALSSASTRVVLPEPEWPTSTTLRTPPGWSAGAAPPVAVDPLLSVIIASWGSIRLSPVACRLLTPVRPVPPFDCTTISLYPLATAPQAPGQNRPACPGITTACPPRSRPAGDPRDMP